MALKASTYNSAKGFTKKYVHGITLKSQALKSWIKDKGFTQRFVAEQLGMSKQKFLKKLNHRKKFNQSEVGALIRLMRARSALKVIWFSSLQEKMRVEKYVKEGQMNNRNNSYFLYKAETSIKEKKREEEMQPEEAVKSWEQSEKLENLIFSTHALPSRKLMRRRNNG